MASRLSLPVIGWTAMALLAAALFTERLVSGSPMAVTADLDHVILVYTVLPRAAVALLAGAALGLSGLLLQRILRNPLAEPSTLGISAGAQLALGASTIYAPSLMDFSPAAVAFGGGIVAVAIVLSLTWRRGLEPVAVVLAGMMVALTANSLSAALILANGDYLFSLFIWGGGSLVQESWNPAMSIGLRLILGLAAAALLLRPLTILGLDDASARSLGVGINVSRFAIIGVAVWIATTVVAEVGVIGFVGLAAPALATLSGARSLKQKLIWTPVVGAILLWLADGLVQLFSGAGGERVPTGAATALLGGPILLWLLPRLRMFEWPSIASGGVAARPASKTGSIFLILAAALLAGIFVALCLGRGPQGWTLGGNAFTDLVQWRTPRVVLAAACGGLLAASGVVIQRVMGNPLASPEVLGVGAGAGAGYAIVLMALGLVTPVLGVAASIAGAMAVLAFILTVGMRGQLGPERLLFAGIALNALCSSVLTAIIALGNMQSYALLRWLSGSTNDATSIEAWSAMAALVLVATPLLMLSRWMDILPLGEATARSLGVPVKFARGVLVFIAAIATAVAAMFVGPLSFVGLIAPHLARLLGLSRPRTQMAGAILLGALLMIVSDWLARMAAFPYQLPVGLFASLLGGPYLIYLLAKGVPRHG